MAEKIKPKKIRLKTKKYVSFSRRSWDVDYMYDIIYGKGFNITEPARITLDGVQKKSLYGAQSPLYGTSFEDEQAFIERYSCDCGAFQSRKYEGEICPICKSEVRERGADITFTGWISLNDGNSSFGNRIIQPLYYNILNNAFGKYGGREILPDIVIAKYKISKNGTVTYPKTEDLDMEPSSPFYGIGMDEFYNRFEEIIEYFMKKKKNKASTFEKILNEKDRVFTSHIPIESNLLRPQSATANTFYYNSADKVINTMFALSEKLKVCTDIDKIEREYFLSRIQQKVNILWDQSFDFINGKDALIRGDVLGGSLKIW